MKLYIEWKTTNKPMFNPYRLNITLIKFKESARTEQKTLSVSALKFCRLKLYREKKIGVCSGTQTKHNNTIWGQKVWFVNVKSAGA